jgi:hypothetical protein
MQDYGSIGPYDELAPAHAFPKHYFRNARKFTREKRIVRDKQIIVDIFAGEPFAQIGERYGLTEKNIRSRLWGTMPFDYRDDERYEDFCKRRNVRYKELLAEIEAKQIEWCQGHGNASHSASVSR